MFALAIAMLVAPVLVYIFTFGFHISDKHARWGEMGSAIGGIYTPILALLTLCFLVRQVILQTAMNDHEYAVTYITQARSDLQFYLMELVKQLNLPLETGLTLKDELFPAMGSLDRKVNFDRHYQVAKAIQTRFPLVLQLWTAINPLFAGLREISRGKYEHNYSTAWMLANSLLTYPGCVALNNYVWLVSQGRIDYQTHNDPDLGLGDES